MLKLDIRNGADWLSVVALPLLVFTFGFRSIPTHPEFTDPIASALLVLAVLNIGSFVMSSAPSVRTSWLGSAFVSGMLQAGAVLAVLFVLTPTLLAVASGDLGRVIVVSFFMLVPGALIALQAPALWRRYRLLDRMACANRTLRKNSYAHLLGLLSTVIVVAGVHLSEVHWMRTSHHRSLAAFHGSEPTEWKVALTTIRHSPYCVMRDCVSSVCRILEARFGGGTVPPPAQRFRDRGASIMGIYETATAPSPLREEVQYALGYSVEGVCVRPD